MRTTVQLPDGEDINEWYAANSKYLTEDYLQIVFTILQRSTFSTLLRWSMERAPIFVLKNHAQSCLLEQNMNIW